MDETGTHYLLQSLELDNFMLHRQTRLGLGERPAILITGANGSGKTQILDALILSMGHHPKRIKKGNLSMIIGPYGDKTSIRLTLRNPRWGNGRALRVEDEALNKMLDADELTIETRVTPASGVSYKLHSGKRTRTIRQKEIRQIFDMVGVKGDNKLAFTEEGTVNLFADHSGRNKFELILDTTGLLQYRQHLLECLGTINRAVEEIDPLRKKLHLERDYLATLERNLELIRHRQQLEDHLAALKVERAWAIVQLHEQELEADRRKVESKQEDRRRMDDRLTSVHEVIGEVRKQLAQRQQASSEFKTERLQLQARRGAVEGELQVRAQAATQARSRRERWESQLAELTPEEDQALVEHPVDLSLLADPASRVEWSLLEAAVRLRRVAAERGLSIEGPICSLLTVPETTVVAARAALGRLAYSLVALDPESLRAGADLMRAMSLPGEILLLDDVRGGLGGPLEEIQGNAAVKGLISQQLSARFGADLTLEQGSWLVGERGVRLDERWVLAPVNGDGPELEALEALLEDGRNYLARIGREQDPARHDELRAYCRDGIEEAAEELARLETENAAAQEERTALDKRLTAVEDELEQRVVEEEDKSLELAELRGTLARRQEELEGIDRILTLYESDLVARRNRIEEVTFHAREVGARPGSVRPSQEVERDLDRTAAKLEELTVTRVNMGHYEAQKEKVASMERELAGSSDHLQGLRKDLNRKYEDWYAEVKVKIEVISQSVKNLLAGIFEGVQVQVANLLDASKASFAIEVKRRGREWRDLSQLSGGEKVLTVEALILSLHLLSDSPVHAIDEFTQRLDHESKAYALEMVCRTVEEAGSRATGAYRPQFLLLCPDVLGIDFDEDLEQIFHRVVITPARIEQAEEVAGVA